MVAAEEGELRIPDTGSPNSKFAIFAKSALPKNLRAIRVRMAIAKGQSLELVDGSCGESNPQRIGLAQEGDLLHVAFDMPFGPCALPESDHIANAIAPRRYFLALEHDRSFEDQDRFVHIVVPVEFTLGAGPDQGYGGAACAA